MHIYSLDFDELNYKDEAGRKETTEAFKILFPNAEDNGIYYVLPVVVDDKFTTERATFKLVKTESNGKSVSNLEFVSYVEDAKAEIKAIRESEQPSETIEQTTETEQ